jgi:hypothetical protein
MAMTTRTARERDLSVLSNVLDELNVKELWFVTGLVADGKPVDVGVKDGQVALRRGSVTKIADDQDTAHLLLRAAARLDSL